MLPLIHSLRQLALLFAAWLLLPSYCDAISLPGFRGGHLKPQYLATALDRKHLFYPEEGSVADTVNFDARLNFNSQHGRWRFDLDYNLQAASGSTAHLAQISDLQAAGRLPDDQRRWLDLTATLDSGDNHYVIHRLDRLSVTYTTPNQVIKLGRQAISWGNGLLFNPADFLNPFDPAAIDTEYKLGDDMAYYQYLSASGNDLQLVHVRRSKTALDTVDKVHSTAARYQGYLGDYEYSLLAAEHYQDQIVGLGWRVAVGEALLQGDINVTRTNSENVVSGVVNLSYATTLLARNLSVIGEYFYNGFGQTDISHIEQLARYPDLLSRLERQELFNSARHYLGLSALLEISPLQRMTTSLFANLNDPSALLQFSGQYDLQQDLQLIGAINLPIGPKGTEYGGYYVADRTGHIGSELGIFMQLSYYF